MRPAASSAPVSTARSTVLATHYRGRELNSPNDIVVKRDGFIYFTDPTFGRMPVFGVPREPELDFRGVYRLSEDGSELTLLVGDFAQPNGLCFSRDESRLYVNDTERGHIRVFNVRPDGLLDDAGVFAPVTGEGSGAPDGMKVDRDDNVYCCGPGGVHVFSPDGQLARRDQDARDGRQLHLGRSRHAFAVPDRLHLALPGPHQDPRRAVVLTAIRAFLSINADRMPNQRVVLASLMALSGGDVIREARVLR